MKKFSFNNIKINDETKKIIQYVLRIILIVFISVVFGLSVYTWNAKSLKGDVFPMPFKIGIGVVMTGSMNPTITEDDLIIVKKTDDYGIDDIVVYQADGLLIVHRIIRFEGDLIVTQGDANNGPDKPIEVKQIKGEVIKTYDKVGNFIKILKSPTGIISILGLSVLLLILSYRKEKEQDNKKLNSIKEEILKLKQEMLEKQSKE